MERFSTNSIIRRKAKEPKTGLTWKSTSTLPARLRKMLTQRVSTRADAATLRRNTPSASSLNSDSFARGNATVASTNAAPAAEG